jgi:hypothetical protein
MAQRGCFRAHELLDRGGYAGKVVLITSAKSGSMNSAPVLPFALPYPETLPCHSMPAINPLNNPFVG